MQFLLLDSRARAPTEGMLFHRRRWHEHRYDADSPGGAAFISLAHGWIFTFSFVNSRTCIGFIRALGSQSCFLVTNFIEQYLHVYVYIYIYIYIHTYTCIYIYIYIYIYSFSSGGAAASAGASAAPAAGLFGAAPAAAAPAAGLAKSLTPNNAFLVLFQIREKVVLLQGPHEC